MQHGHAALEVGLHLGITGSGEAYLTELIVLLAPGAARQRRSDETDDDDQMFACHGGTPMEGGAHPRAGRMQLVPKKGGTSHHQGVTCLPMALALPQRRDFGRSSWQLADRFNRRLVKHTTLAGLSEGCMARIPSLTARPMSRSGPFGYLLALRI